MKKLILKASIILFVFGGVFFVNISESKAQEGPILSDPVLREVYCDSNKRSRMCRCVSEGVECIAGQSPNC